MTDPRALALARQSDEELLAARSHPNMGDVGRARIDAELARRADRTSVDGLERVSPAPWETPAGPGRMNKTERRYADVLDAQGVRWLFGEVKLAVGVERCFYTPDFYLPASHTFVEVKGAYMREDARVKFQAAAKEYAHFGWRLVQWKEGRWWTLADYPVVRVEKAGD